MHGIAKNTKKRGLIKMLKPIQEKVVEKQQVAEQDQPGDITDHLDAEDIYALAMYHLSKANYLFTYYKEIEKK